MSRLRFGKSYSSNDTHSLSMSRKMQGLSYGSGEEGSGITTMQELRFLPPIAVSKLARILESNPGWREIMGLVPCDPWKPGESIPEGHHYPKKYTWDDINTISEECCRCHREGFEALLEEWGTSGRQRPLVQDLIHLLKRTELYRALDYLTVTVMNGDPVPRGGGNNAVEELNQALEQERTHQDVVFGTYVIDAKNAPTFSSVAEAMNVDNLNNSTHLLLNNQVETRQTGQAHTLDAEVLRGMDCSNVFHFSYVSLKTITSNFSDVAFSDGGNKLGEGAFGKVYFAKVMQNGREEKVAVKRLNAADSSESRVELQFKTEIEVLSRCTHENLVPLVGYSCDGPDWCLVYSYMPCGSLQDCLSCSNGRDPLDWKTRIRIGEGSARGIVHLHTYQERPLVHRDVKSANILLDETLTPRVGDFGLVRLGGTGTHTRTLIKTTTVFGTSAYMAPEAFRGDISVKMDTFSFGVVLLELLTGLAAFDEDREEPDLLNHVREAQESEEGIKNLVDANAGDWDMDVFTGLLLLAGLCCVEAKNKRPTMVQTLEKYAAIVSSVS